MFLVFYLSFILKMVYGIKWDLLVLLNLAAVIVHTEKMLINGSGLVVVVVNNIRAVL